MSSRRAQKVKKPELWNIAVLKPPDGDFCEYRADDVEVIESVSNFVTALTTSADIIGPSHPVWNEIKVFQSLQVRLALKLPCDKFLHILQRVGCCLQRFTLLGLSKLCLDLAEKFLSGLSEPSQKILLPSRHQLEYLLIRTQSTAKLLCETLSFTRETFCYLVQRLHIGHALQNLLMACSVTARISIFFKALLLQVCTMYKTLKPWCQELRCGTWKWDRELELPDDLWEWLKPEDLEFTSQKTFPESNLKFLSKLFNKVTDDKLPEQNNTTEPLRDDNFTAQESDKSEDNRTTDIDYGEVLSRSKETSDALDNSQNMEKILLSKIGKSKSFKSLWAAWISICGSESLKFNFKKTKQINAVFYQLQQKIVDIHQLNLSLKEKKSKVAEAVNGTGKEVIRLLKWKRNKQSQNLEADVQEVVSVTNPKVHLKPTKKLACLKRNFHYVNSMLQFTKQKKLSLHLKKLYKANISDIKLLKKNGEIRLAEKLIRRTSKIMIKMFQTIKL